MNREEYVKTIERALVGHVSAEELQDTVTYYRDYIDMEMRKGKTEEEVLTQLGNPRLLAKSIISAKERRIEDDEERIEREEKKSGRGFHVPLVILIVIALIVLWLVFCLLFAFAKFAIPILLPVAIVMGIMSILKKMK